jgi:TRAP-type uncharacterized transport system substrate-binding protein
MPWPNLRAGPCASACLRNRDHPVRLQAATCAEGAIAYPVGNAFDNVGNSMEWAHRPLMPRHATAEPTLREGGVSEIMPGRR